MNAKELSESSFLIAEVGRQNFNDSDLWSYLRENKQTGIEVSLTEKEKEIFITGSSQSVHELIDKLYHLITIDPLRILPVFIKFRGDENVLSAVISESAIHKFLFFLPDGGIDPQLDQLIRSDKRILLFIEGPDSKTGRLMHHVNDFIIEVTATGKSTHSDTPNVELLSVKGIEKLVIGNPAGDNIRNLVPDYINFLLEIWTRYGKRPNFIFLKDEIRNFDFIIYQLNSFTWVKGTARESGKTFEKVYWKNPDISGTGGRFSFPYRGGEELTLTPVVPGYKLMPEHIVVTGEMEVPESYNLMATPLLLSDGITGSFKLDKIIRNELLPEMEYDGSNYAFIQDTEQGSVLSLPENASINLRSPDIYDLRNSSFTISCNVRFDEIIEPGDNAVLGNYENEYRKGLHLILRSGHPYFGLWANDYISETKLIPNRWYHIAWRYIIESGEQAIFLDGKNIGSSDGHPPFSGTGDIYLGSALKQGASMKGWISNLNIWNRPLSTEEITRVALNEQITSETDPIDPRLSQQYDPKVVTMFLLLSLGIALSFLFLFKKKKMVAGNPDVMNPVNTPSNRIILFGGFRATDNEGNEISGLFTPKIKELLIFSLLAMVKNGDGAPVSAIDENLWPDLDLRKVSNNRAVTLTKLRKIIQRIDGLKIQTQNGVLHTHMTENFYCDYIEVHKMSQSPGGMNADQLKTFFKIVSKGKFLNGLTWQWLDESRGYISNLVIDNLLKLAFIYKGEKKLPELDSIAELILDYDDLNEEAIWLKIWCLQQRKDSHQARFYFDLFIGRYKEALAENYPMTYNEFLRHFSSLPGEIFSKVTSQP